MKAALFARTQQTRPHIIFLLLGIILMVYFTVVSIYWGRFDNFNFIMDIGGALLIITSYKIKTVIKLISKLPKPVRIMFKAILVVFVLSFFIVEVIIICNMRETSQPGVDYVIVLGCQVNGSIPSIPLKRRVNTAVKYLEENHDTNVVISGGKGRGENMPESEVMKILLKRSRIDEKRIFAEDKATSTMENLMFSDALYNISGKSVAIVTSDYHIFRALLMAKKLKYKNTTGLPCRSQLSMLPAYLVREYAAVMYYMILGRI
jgi:uncharacterized SAM-binding protein YcdF (DUF218 family)